MRMEWGKYLYIFVMTCLLGYAARKLGVLVELIFYTQPVYFPSLTSCLPAEYNRHQAVGESGRDT